ncbi:UNVERIFIED_CONTAM: hypothetical protein GTU68_035658, partial [Idotea baltica]|nr:hypothetical protein [Idotea baltica]
FDDRTIIVTGGASGIGAAVCDELAASGATVIVADLNQAASDAKAAEIEKAGGKAFGCAVDVSKSEQVEAMIAFAVDKTGRLDGLVNNAGISVQPTPTADVSLDDWKRTLDINLSGVFYGLRFGIPAMLKSGGGAVVNVASILGSVGSAGASAYVSAKHGVVGLTKAAAADYATQGVRVNAVGPGYIRTPMLENDLDAETLAFLASLHPIQRMGEAEEVSALILFLLSDRASFITGSYHLVDGGYTAQ